MFDIIIQNGTVYDGSGAPGQKADLGIRQSHIEAIGDLSSASAARTIDAGGKAVAPGFIDMHSHGDFMLPFLPTADSKIHQGITTEVVGNCGSSMAPLSPKMLQDMNEDYAGDGAGRKVTWQTFGEFLSLLKQQGVAVNVVPLVGHGTVREKVMGMSNAEPTPEQLRQMQDEVRRAMDEGAVGFTTGLIYTPNVYARPAEVVALARTAAERGGLYTTHMRGEGNTLLEAIDEALDACRQAEIPLQISHLKASGMRNWHKMALGIEKIHAARAQGLDVTADMYTYPASNTGLTSLIPDWAHVGGREAFLARLQDPATRARIHEELSDPLNSNGVGWDKIYISSCPPLPEVEGRHLQEIADERRVHPLDATMDILVAARLNADIIMFTMSEENVALGLKQEFVAIGTDAGGRAFEGPLTLGKSHPRNFGAFPRMLGKYVREDNLVSLPEALRKMTSLPASKLGLKKRGLLKTGYFADVVVFDPQSVADRSTFVQPNQRPAGIEWVLVNGSPVVAQGSHSGALPGEILR